MLDTAPFYRGNRSQSPVLDKLKNGHDVTGGKLISGKWLELLSFLEALTMIALMLAKCLVG
jgi:hypothetical protein